MAEKHGNYRRDHLVCKVLNYRRCCLVFACKKLSSSHVLTAPVPNPHEHEDPKDTAHDLTLSSKLDTNESDNKSLPSPEPLPEETLSTPHKDRVTSQKSMVRYVLDNKGVTHVPECDAYIIRGHNKKKITV